MNVNTQITLTSFNPSSYAANSFLCETVMPLFLAQRGGIVSKDIDPAVAVVDYLRISDLKNYVGYSNQAGGFRQSFSEKARYAVIKRIFDAVQRPVNSDPSSECDLMRLPSLFVEVKRINGAIPGGLAQCIMYMLRKNGSRFGVVTNINRWQFVELHPDGATSISGIYDAFKPDDVVKINGWLTHINLTIPL